MDAAFERKKKTLPFPLPLRVAGPVFALGWFGRSRLGHAVLSASFTGKDEERNAERARSCSGSAPWPRRPLTALCCRPPLVLCTEAVRLLSRPACNLLPDCPAGCRCMALSGNGCRTGSRRGAPTSLPVFPSTTLAADSERRRTARNGSFCVPNAFSSVRLQNYG